MSDKKLIKNLKIHEIDNICESANGCANCPLLISSYHKEIHCIRDDVVKMHEVEDVHKLLNTEIDLDEISKEG